jgi:hypothetical protein
MLPPDAPRTPAILDTVGHGWRRAWPALCPALARAGHSVRRRRYEDVLTGFGPAPAEETAAGLA